MNTFTPSPSFAAFFTALMAQANAPMTSSSGYNLSPPVLTDPHERYFYEHSVLPFWNAMKQYADSLRT